jgi:hypothetical protein
MDLGVRRISENEPNSDSIKNYKMKTKLNSGFKVGLGASFDRDDWEVTGEYTWLRPSSRTNFHVDLVQGNLGHGFFYNTWLIGTNRIRYDIAHPFDLYAQWKVFFDRAELELARPFYSGTKFSLRPNLGLALLRLDQHFNYEIRPQDYPVAYNYLKAKSFSLGPKIGVDLNYMFGAGISLIGKFDLGLMYAKNKVQASAYSQRTTFTHLGQDDVRYAAYRQPAIRDFEDLKIGLAWGSYFAGSRANFLISFLYELQRYSNVNYMKQYMSKLLVTIPDTFTSNEQTFYPTDTPAGAYFTQGLSANLRFDF